jgi:hypothetical protein
MSYICRTLPLLFAVVICALSVPHPSRAAGWPDNWLGPADTAYAHLHIGVFYYGAVLDDLPADPGSPSPLPLSGAKPDGTPLPGNAKQWLQELTFLPDQTPAGHQAEFERTMAELHENAGFYWRNTRFNCALTFENIETNFSPTLRSEVLKNDPPYNGPIDVPKYGGAREEYDGLLHIVVLYRYSPLTGQLERVTGGGGWTWGCVLKDKDTGKKLCGWSWWAAPPASHDCGSDWLLCHEFGHQLDSLFHESGHPEHWFNHLSRAEANTARFGEHFDCMSYILRRTPEADWRDLQWGEQRSYADADADGMPDADDWLARAGLATDPDPATSDSDADGLSDRAELLAVNGNRNGHGERLHPALDLPGPTDPDADHDGVADGADPLPWLAMPAFIPQTADSAHAAWLSGPDDPQADPLVSAVPCAMALPAAGAAQPLWVRLSYEQDTALLVELAWGAAESAADSECRVVLDLENDGWFNGDDNYRLQFDATGLAYAALNKAGSYADWPSEDKAAVDKAACGFEWQTPAAGFRHACRLRFTKANFPAFQGKAGERIGVNIGVREQGKRWFYMLGEPNTQLPLELR